MRKQAHIIKHRNGFFLAINGDLNTREVIINGFVKGMQTLKQYYKGVRNTYIGYDLSPIAVVTGYDLTDEKEYISIEDLWDPNLHKIDMETGEVTYIEVNKREFEEEDEEVLKDEIVKTQDKSARSLAALKGWETKRKNLKLKIAQQEADEAHQEYLKQQEKPKATKRVVEVACEIADQTAKQLKANKQAKDEAPAPEASHINNPVNHNNMKTENQAPNSAQSNGKPFAKRARRGLAKGAEVGVTLTTDLLIGSLIVGSDVLFTMAEGVAWGQAVIVKPLGLHPDATRRELKEEAIARSERRTALLYSAPKAIIQLPSKIVAMKRATKERNDNTIVDIPNVEVVS